jgi:FAD/FMN-containing dehydrogenase
VEIVTADGELRRANADENADLFWALRGGGGNFGVVTEFEFRLHPMGPEVFGGLIAYPLAAAREVLRAYRKFVVTLPDEADLGMGMLTTPDGHAVVGLLPAHNTSVTEGEQLFARLREFGPVAMDGMGPMAYTARQAQLDEPAGVHGLQRYWKSGFTTDFGDGLIEALVETAETFASPLTAIISFHMHGAAIRVPADATAFGLRQRQWDINLVGQWVDPGESQVQTAWVRERWAAIEEHVSGSAYLNHLAGDDSPEKVRASYGPALPRLKEVKAKFDPGNLFRLNANIAPA